MGFMDESKLPTPHNNLFQYALSHARAARDLIQKHLPADLVAALDLDSLELQKDSFIDDELLATDPFLQSILGLLKYSRRKDFAGKLEFLLRCLLESGTAELHLEHLEAVVVYITEVSPSITVEKLEMTIHKIFQTQFEPGSIADQYLRKGRMQGIEEGRQEGRQEGILEGLKKGEIHLIQTLQEILSLPLGDPASFQDRSLEELQAISTVLRQRIRDRK